MMDNDLIASYLIFYMDPIPSYRTRASLGVLLAAFGLVVVFHFLAAERPFGLPLLLFLLAGLAAVHVVAWLGGGIRNRWAYLFFIPLGLSMLAEILYASDVVRAFGFIIGFVSFALFAYWLTAETQTFKHLPSFWPFRFFAETILPFPGLNRMFAGRTEGKHAGQIALGLFIALPFLLIFGALFASADPLFRDTLSNFFRLDDPAESVARLIRDAIAGIFFLAFGWRMFTRLMERRGKVTEKTWELFKNRTALDTFLAAINLLFVIFIIFQFIYFFRGEKAIEGHLITYATYAREGFFQLLVVAGLVFILNAVLYRVTDMRVLLTRILASALILQTGVVIASAIRRLTLYIGAYGLTVDRWWAMAVMIIIALVLLAILVGIWGRLGYAPMAKGLFFTVLLVIPILLLTNVEKQVAQWNISRQEAGATTEMDWNYLVTHLSSDAIPEIVEAVNRGMAPLWVKGKLQLSRDRLQERSKDWRDMVWSDYRALAVLGSLK